MSVKRYNVDASGRPWADALGEWVPVSDYAAILRDLDEAVALLVETRGEIAWSPAIMPLVARIDAFRAKMGKRK